MLNKRILFLVTVLVMLVGAFGVAAQAGNIVEVAAANAQFSTLAGLVEAAGLTDALTAAGPLAVYAPNNDAFAKLPQIVLDYLGSHPEDLTRVLNYHVVAGEMGATTTLEGSDLVLGADMTTVNDASILGSLEASNGTIYEIDEVLVPAFTLEEVVPATLVGDVIADGSSTVEPLAIAVVAQFVDEGFSGQITVGESGTGGGFKAFCEELVTDVSDASRPIKSSSDPANPNELEKCLANGRTPIPFRVGTDGIAVVVSTANDFATDVTPEELAAIFSTAVNWSDVRPDWPAEPILRYIPGTDSGTFDFFVETVFEKDSAPSLAASNLNQSENDNVLVQGVESSPYAVGYFGYAYYLANAASLKLLAIDGVQPNLNSVEDGSYLLARPLFIYSDPAIMAEKPQVAGYINYFLTNVDDLIEGVGYFPLSDFALNRSRLNFLAATAAQM
ncbi:MAG: substrate-binding domain-containing protein [Anaerolineae bacterium]|nr:substrate-binding domain-containing protein [Anaerolineae bacterium]